MWEILKIAYHDYCSLLSGYDKLLQCKYKEKFVILQSIGIIAIKVVKQGQSSTPADMLVDIFNPYNSANGLN